MDLIKDEISVQQFNQTWGKVDKMELYYKANSSLIECLGDFVISNNLEIWL